MHYRFVQQITAYHEGGDVSYQDFVAHSSSVEYSGENPDFSLDHIEGAGSFDLSMRTKGNDVSITVEGIETRGAINSWIRIAKPGSDTFGSNTELEIWVGSEEPSD